MKNKDKEDLQEGPWSRFELMFSVLHEKSNKISFLKADKKYQRDCANLDTAVIEEKA